MENLNLKLVDGPHDMPEEGSLTIKVQLTDGPVTRIVLPHEALHDWTQHTGPVSRAKSKAIFEDKKCEILRRIERQLSALEQGREYVLTSDKGFMLVPY